MCVITICKIFKCWHLEAVFGVERCERAIESHSRYCDRECSPPVLKGEFSSPPAALCTACTVCAVLLSDRDRAPDRDRGLDPINGLTDEAFRAYFYVNFPLMQLFRREDVNLDRFIDDEWCGPIRRARERTRRFQARFLHRRFPLDEAHLREERFEFGRVDPRWSSDNQHIDMEILVIHPCDERCPCRRRRRRGSVTELPTPPPSPPPPPRPPHRHPLRSHPVPLSIRLYAPPLPRSDIELIERWVDLAREIPGATEAGVEHVLPSLWEREMRGLAALDLVETIQDAGLDLDWAYDNGLSPEGDQRLAALEPVETVQDAVLGLDWVYDYGLSPEGDHLP